MNGHVEKRIGKKGVRWHVVYYVDKAHGGPARRSGGTYALKREAQDNLVRRIRSTPSQSAQPSVSPTPSRHQKPAIVRASAAR